MTTRSNEETTKGAESGVVYPEASWAYPPQRKYVAAFIGMILTIITLLGIDTVFGAFMLPSWMYRLVVIIGGPVLLIVFSILSARVIAQNFTGQ